MTKPLYIPQAESEPGLRVWCRKCRKDIYEICLLTNEPISTCKFGGKHVFKVYTHVPGTKYGMKKKNLKTRSLTKAKKQTMEFIKEVRSTHGKISSLNIRPQHIPARIKNPASVQPELLKDAMVKYLAFLKDDGVEIYYKKYRGEKHLQDLNNELLYLLRVLADNGYDLSTLPVTAFFNKDVIGIVYKDLKENYSPRTLEKRFSLYKAFEKWLHEELKYPLSIAWKKVPLQKPTYDPKSISKEDYYRLVEVIIPQNGIGDIIKNGKPAKRDYYTPWLSVGIRLALHVGCRRPELIDLKFEDIIEVEGENPYLRVENKKVNRIMGITDPKQKIYMPIPISRGLIELLKELGIEEHRGSSRYLLAPEIMKNRAKIMDTLTRGFTHFFQLVSPKSELKFKNLRKTNLTYKKVLGNDNNTTHSDAITIKKHYEDKVIIARSLFGYQLFPANTVKKDHKNFWE